MQSYKRITTLFCSVFAVVLLLASCVSKNSTRQTESTSFVVGKVEGKSYIPQMDSTGLPSQRNFQFKACLVDSIQYKVIPDYVFQIEMSNGRSVTARTDTKGCLVWDEVLRFGFGRSPVWLTVERTIRAAGGSAHSGAVQLDLAINPWLGDDSKIPNILDLRYERQSIPADKILDKAQSQQAFTAVAGQRVPLSERPQLWVPSATVIIDEVEFSHVEDDKNGNRSGALLNIEVAFEPRLRVRDVTGGFSFVPLIKGRLALKPYLIADAQGGETAVIVNQEVEPAEIILEDGVVRKTFQVRVPFLPNTGNVNFGLRVKYVNPQASTEDPGVLDFEGIFRLGAVSQLLGRRIVNPNPETLKSIERRADKRSEMDTNPMGLLGAIEAQSQKLPLGFGKVGYRLSRAKVNFTAVSGDVCESAVQREVRFQVESCVYDPFTLKGVAFTDFEISRVRNTNKGEELVPIEVDKTLFDGCFIWEDSQKHQYYDNQDYVTTNYVIENKALNFKETITIRINPWDYGFTFGREASQLTDPKKSQSVPELVLHTFNANFKEQTYIIDDLLNLDVQKLFTYQFQPRILRHDSLTDGVNARADLRDGAYIARIVLVRHRQEATGGEQGMAIHKDEANRLSLEQSKTLGAVRTTRPNRLPEYITHSEQPVVVRDGRVTLDVSYTLRELYLLGSRNSIVVELLPVEVAGLVFEPNSGCQIDVQKSKFLPSKEEKLKIWSYEAPQVLNDLNSNGIFKQVAYSAGEIIAQKDQSPIVKRYGEYASAPVDQKELATLNNFAFREGLRRVDLSQPAEMSRLVDQFNMQVKEITRYQEKTFYSGRNVQASFEEALNDLPTYYKNISRNYETKLNGFYFQPVKAEDVQNIIYSGVLPADDMHPSVYQFAHLMCGWWADQYFDYYMTREQIQSIGKWLENKDDIKSVEDWLRVDANIYSQPLNPGFPFRENYYRKINGSRFLTLIKDIFEMRFRRDFYRMCMNDPFEFFTFEKKISVEKVANHERAIQYLGGDSQNYNVNKSFRVDKSYGWDSTLSYKYSLGGSLTTMDSLFGLLRGINIFSFAGIHFGGDWSTSRTEKQGRYRGENLNFNKGPTLVVGRSTFNIELEKYQHCLIVRPTTHSFDELDRHWLPELKDKTADQLPYRRSGVMFCGGVRTAEPNGQAMRITESYYYLQQTGFGDYLLDPANIKNRPFLLGLRGHDSFNKFLHLTRGVVEPNYKADNRIPEGVEKADPLIGLIKSFRIAEARDLTGFYPGIYTVTDFSSTNGDKKDQNYFNKFFEFIADQNPFGFLEFDESKH